MQLSWLRCGCIAVEVEIHVQFVVDRGTAAVHASAEVWLC